MKANNFTIDHEGKQYKITQLEYGSYELEYPDGTKRKLNNYLDNADIKSGWSFKQKPEDEEEPGLAIKFGKLIEKWVGSLDE